ncbi:MAG TPA: hypothetical protein VJP02_22005 [Candidatus Sulfotelmatobacter sp.]|nr:hypothetical protein [Candidatus Sulfotelmatobacter sp.]
MSASPRLPSLSMAVVTAAVEVVAPTLVLVVVSAVAAPLAASAAAVVMAAAFTAARRRSAVGDRPRGLPLIPAPQVVQIPDARGLGKVTVAATQLPDGISSHPATLGRSVAERVVLRPGPALPPWQQGLPPRRITRR